MRKPIVIDALDVVIKYGVAVRHVAAAYFDYDQQYFVDNLPYLLENVEPRELIRGGMSPSLFKDYMPPEDFADLLNELGQ